MTRDSLYSQALEKLQAFAFDEKVADVFDDMIRRSVPIYPRILQLLPIFVNEYITKIGLAFNRTELKIYDLGSSLGATSLAIADYIDKFESNVSADFYLVDNSEAMYLRSKQLVPTNYKNINFNFILDNIEFTDIQDADIVLLNFTLQFFEPQKRLQLLKNIYNGLKPEGFLILSEKIHFENTCEQNFLQNKYWRFKAFNGYSELEISQKRQSLENVLITDSAEQHKARMAEAGFKESYLWLQEFNFVSFLAEK